MSGMEVLVISKTGAAIVFRKITCKYVVKIWFRRVNQCCLPVFPPDASTVLKNYRMDST